jgi:hypothetical protein
MIPTADPTDTPLADLGPVSDDDAIAYASGMIRDYCGWRIFPSAELTMILDTRCGPMITVPTLRMTDLGEVVGTSDLAVLDSVSWSEVGILFRAAGFPGGLRAVSVTFTSGYDEVPPAIEAATRALASRLTRRTDIVQEVAGSVSMSYLPGAMTALERLVLDRYRIIGRT